MRTILNNENCCNLCYNLSMENNEALRQSASTAEIIDLGEGEYAARIRNALIGKITCDISAVFPRCENAIAWVESFGFSGYDYRILVN